MATFQEIYSESRFSRKQIILSSTPSTGATTGFGSSYILLGASATTPCRIRLYSDSASVAIDDLRPTSSFNISASVGLILDTELDASIIDYKFDPPIIGTTFSASQTWYNISSSTAQDVALIAYPIEYPEFDKRSTIEISGTNLYPGTTGISGIVTSPKAFIILSGSSDLQYSRLRLYSTSSVPYLEQIRPFGTEPNTGSNLIVDIAFDSASFAYKFVPVVEAYNLATYDVGQNWVYYILQNNKAPGTGPESVTAKLNIYAIED